MDGKEARAINDSTSVWLSFSDGVNWADHLSVHDLLAAAPLPETSISGLCPTNQGPRHGSRWNAKTEKRKSRREKGSCSKLGGRKLQNLLLKYNFGWKALNISFPCTFFSIYLSLN